MKYTNNELMEIFEKTMKSKTINASEKTIDDYKRIINYVISFLDNKSIYDITLNDLKAYVETLEDNSYKTYNLRICAIRRFYECLKYNYRTADDFSKNIAKELTKAKADKNEVEKVPLSKEERIAILENLKDDRMKAIVYLLMSTGVRIHELTSLTLSQYLNRNEENKTILMTVTKGSVNRDMFINDMACELIDTYLKTRKECECDKLFVSNRGTEMNRNVVSRAIKDSAIRSGIFTDERVSQMCNHIMRTTLCSTLVNNGESIPNVQKILGHKNASTTLKYYAKANIGSINSALENFM